MPTYLVNMRRKKYSLGFYSDSCDMGINFLITSPKVENVVKILDEISASNNNALDLSNEFEYYIFKSEKYYVAKYDYKEYNPSYHKKHCKNGCKCGSDWVPVST